MKTQGYSAFGNVTIPGTDHKLSVFGRYDSFNIDSDDLIAEQTSYSMVITGLSYELYKGNLVLVTFESTDYDADAAGKGKLPVAGTNLGHERKMQAVYQIKF